jgi:hypothetical protein
MVALLEVVAVVHDIRVRVAALTWAFDIIYSGYEKVSQNGRCRRCTRRGAAMLEMVAVVLM